MRTRARAAIVVIALAVIAWVIVLPSASGQTEIHLVFGPEGQITNGVLDLHDDGLRPGDRLQARAPLWDETQTNRLGTAYVDCVVHRRIASPTQGLWGCNYALRLADGDILLQGLDPRGPGKYEMAVLGGTVAYAGANGDARFTDVNTEDADGYTDMVIRVTVP